MSRIDIYFKVDFLIYAAILKLLIISGCVKILINSSAEIITTRKIFHRVINKTRIALNSSRVDFLKVDFPIYIARGKSLLITNRYLKIFIKDSAEIITPLKTFMTKTELH